MWTYVLIDSCNVALDTNGRQVEFTIKGPGIGMGIMVTRARLRCARGYLKPGLCSQRKLAAMEIWYKFPPKYSQLYQNTPHMSWKMFCTFLGKPFCTYSRQTVLTVPLRGSLIKDPGRRIIIRWLAYAFVRKCMQPHHKALTGCFLKKYKQKT